RGSRISRRSSSASSSRIASFRRRMRRLVTAGLPRLVRRGLAHQLPLVALDRVARLELVEAIEGHATLLARGDLAHVVLHAPQRRQAAVVDHLAPAQDAYQPAARDGALHDEA